MLGHAKAGLAMGGERVHRVSRVVVVEMSRAGGAPRGQDSPIQRKATLNRISLHLEQSCDVTSRLYWIRRDFSEVIRIVLLQPSEQKAFVARKSERSSAPPLLTYISCHK